MGYTTEFRGRFNLNKPLDITTHEFLKKFAHTRRMARRLPSAFGIEGEFYVDGTGYAGQDHDNTVIDYNRHPSTQPSLWCQWVPTDDGMGIEWDGNEKFYNYVEWLKYLIVNFLAPRGYVMIGEVEFQGESPSDFGKIVVVNNEVKTLKGRRSYE